MTGLPPTTPGVRFPGFDVLAESEHWDPVTTGVVLARLGRAPDIRFFTPAEEAAAGALVDQLLCQHSDSQPDEQKIPVLQLIDSRLAEQQTDGWHYADMPQDSQAWRDSVSYLDEDAQSRFDSTFATCTGDQQAAIIQAVQDLGSDDWHGMSASRVWSLWTRYACSAFYSHPSAWNEIGFSGPAYPRGYKNIDVDALEAGEVHDARPSDDPLRGTS